MNCEHLRSLNIKFKRTDNTVIREIKCNECEKIFNDTVVDDGISLAILDAAAELLG